MLGLAAIFSGLTNGWILIAGGSIILVVGIALVVYYMTFGVFYDQESFLVTTFGKRSIVYRYGQITGQQLYNASEICSLSCIWTTAGRCSSRPA